MAAAMAFAIVACDGKKKKHSGTIKIDLYVYNDPRGNAYDSFHLPLASLYFIGDEIIEEIPANRETARNAPSFAYVKKGRYAALSELSEKNSPALEFRLLSEKDIGIRFIADTLHGYGQRTDMTDTAFNGFSYKRTRIATKEAFAVFYIHQTDTVLPFSLAPAFERDYRGVLNRVDTYEYGPDRFTSLRMSVSDTVPKRFYDALKSR